MGTPPWLPTYRDLHVHRCSVVVPSLNLPSHYSFRRINDNQLCDVGQQNYMEAKKFTVYSAIPIQVIDDG